MLFFSIGFFIVGRGEGVNCFETKAYAIFGRLVTKRFGPGICSEQTGYYGNDFLIILLQNKRLKRYLL